MSQLLHERIAACIQQDFVAPGMAAIKFTAAVVKFLAILAAFIVVAVLAALTNAATFGLGPIVLALYVLDCLLRP